MRIERRFVVGIGVLIAIGIAAGLRFVGPSHFDGPHNPGVSAS